MKQNFITLILLLFLAPFSYADIFPNRVSEGEQFITADIDKDDIEEEIDISVGTFEEGGFVAVLRVKDGEAITTAAFRTDMYTTYITLIEISPQLEPYIAVHCGAGMHEPMKILPVFFCEPSGGNMPYINMNQRGKY